jgi:hypothetical protein
LKKTLLVILCLAPLALFCQLSGFSKAKKFAIGLVYSPDFCYRIATADASYRSTRDFYNTVEIPKFGYTTGLNFLWQLNKKFSLEAGALYSDKGYQTKQEPLSNGLYGGNFVNQPDNAVSGSFVYHIQFLDIPLKVNYYLLRTGVKLFLSGGLSTNIFLGEKDTYTVTYGDGHTTTRELTPYSTPSAINLSVVAGIGISFHISRQLLVRIEPVYRQSLTPLSYSPIKYYLYSAGLNTGLYYRF